MQSLHKEQTGIYLSEILKQAQDNQYLRKKTFREETDQWRQKTLSKERKQKTRNLTTKL